MHASLSLSARVRRSGAGGAPSYDRRAPAEGWSSLLSRLPRRRRTGPGATAPQGTGPGATAPQRRQRGRRQRWRASGAASRGVRLARIGPAEVPGDSLVMREKEIRVREAEETELVRGGELLRRRPARGARWRRRQHEAKHVVREVEVVLLAVEEALATEEVSLARAEVA